MSRPDDHSYGASSSHLLTQHALKIKAVSGAKPDVFENVKPLWRPLWARGAFGGTLIAQALMAAHETTPAGFFVHSMHCLFINSVEPETPLAYHVDRIRDGKTVASRGVDVYQSGKRVFTAQLSFAQEISLRSLDGRQLKTLHHTISMPSAALAAGPPTDVGEPVPTGLVAHTSQADDGSMYESVRLPRDGSIEGEPHTIRLLQWIRLKTVPFEPQAETPSEADLIKAHLAALAYASDHYFIGTVLRVNNVGRFDRSAAGKNIMSSFDTKTEKGRIKMRLFRELVREEAEEIRCVAANRTNTGSNKPDAAEFMVSLDHTIYFHEPTAVRADDWLLIEQESPWSGNERGLVIQRIWNRKGVLIATCIQEGMIRVKQDTTESKL